ncbi:bifunctional folylpolyglutamate synthase/dihydrofolate synthase [Mariniphaga sediminis]|uniref:bifunctional folylpolyglutamate synthase/dihydrofolate synthase n=1 Tax=Mariniphaga sediminis TaxID=1628158 RepID=UPI003567BA45
MDYTETLDFLFSRLPMYQRIGPAAYKDNLDNTLRLDNYYGNPHRHFKTIHVAGTNGKGSVSHMLAAVFQAAGYKTGLYTSPHLKDFRERIRINGEMISTDEVVEWVDTFRTNNELWKIEPSFFELTVAMAFDYFARRQVDIAIVEVGLGGRLDSTNIITPEVSIITNIGLDHTAILGDSLEKIALEKAGIIKAGVPVVIGTTQTETKPVFDEVAALKLAPLFYADQEYSVAYALTDTDGNQLLSVEKNGETLFSQVKLDLKGMYQQKNLPAVLKTVELLRQMEWEISDESLLRGLAFAKKMTGLQGRWHILGYNPLLVCDTAHNAEGMTEIVSQLNQTPCKKLHIVLGVVNDKDTRRILSLLPPDAEYYFTRADIPRGLDEKGLALLASEYGLNGATFSSVEKAFASARSRADKNDIVFVGGSTFVVAEIL